MDCTPGINLKTRFGGLKAMLSGERSFFIECSGEGDLFLTPSERLSKKTLTARSPWTPGIWLLGNPA